MIIEKDVLICEIYKSIYNNEVKEYFMKDEKKMND